MTWTLPDDPYLDTHRTRTNVRIEVDGQHVADGTLIGEDHRGVFVAIPTPTPITTEERA